MTESDSSNYCLIRKDILERINQALRMLYAHIYWVGVFSIAFQISFIFPWISSRCEDDQIVAGDKSCDCNAEFQYAALLYLRKLSLDGQS